MNSQTANTYPDTRIDQVLNALRTAEPPAGLEQRIAARLAQAAQARTLPASSHAPSPSPFAIILGAVKSLRISLTGPTLYATTATALLLFALTTITILHHRAPTTTARTTPITVAPSSSASVERAALPSRHNAPIRRSSLVAAASSNPLPPSAQDPDALALAETLAPSRPAPPLPLTPQEHILLAATRTGQPIQVAELDVTRAPILRAAAEARETASIGRYVKSLLAPFAVADKLSPTTFSQPQETSTPPAPPSNSSSN